MPQIQVTTSTPVGYDIAAMQSQISTMIANMSAGKSILASEVGALITMYNQFRIHYHTVSDLRGQDTFGNVGVYGGGIYVANNTTTTTLLAATLPVNVTAAGEILATDINTIISFLNSVRIHLHDITDVIS